MTSKVVYSGDLRTQLTHIMSGAVVITDAPTDNHGKGEAFSPTDLLATSLASCMLTVVAIKANNLGIDIIGSTASVTKHMERYPRRVSKVEIGLYLNGNIDAKSRNILEKTAITCPVALSLSANVEQKVEFCYSD